MSNFLVSSDEERRINDILDMGINELKPVEPIDYKLKNRINSTSNTTPINISSTNNNNRSFSPDTSNTNSNSNILKSSMINSQDLNLNYNYNYATFNTEENSNSNRNDINKPHNPDLNLNTYNMNYNYSNNTNSISSSQLQQSQVKVKSSALKRLLDEMKTNNKYASTSEDEVELEFNSKRNTKTQHSNKYIPDYAPKFNANTQISISTDKNMENTCNPNKISVEIHKENSYSQSIMNTPNLGEKLISNLNTIKSKSDLSFHDVKYDIKTLQEKITGLERKLFLEEDLVETEENHYKDCNTSMKIKSVNKHILKNKLNESKFKISHSARSNNSSKNNSTSKTKYKSKLLQENSLMKSKSSFRSDDEEFTRKKINVPSLENENAYKKTRLNRFSNQKENSCSNFTNSSLSSKKSNFQTKFLNLSERANSHSFRNNFLPNSVRNNYEEKYKQLKIDYDILKSSLVKERQKTYKLEQKNEKIRKKGEIFDDLQNKHEKLDQNYNILLNKLDESELIRKEQSKLIKSLQREIDILRGNFQEGKPCISSRVIEEYKELRKDFTLDGEKKSNKKKKKKKSKSKPKLKLD